MSQTTSLRKVGGLAAWRGPDIAQATDWIYRLSDAERREILDAFRHYQASGVADLDAVKDDFPLPTFSATLRRLTRETESGRGILLMRNLPLEDLSEAEIHRLYWGLSLHIGVILPQSPQAEMIGDIRDRGMAGETRGYQSGKPLGFHTDACDIVLLLSRRRAKAGGASRLASTAAVHDYLVDTRPDIVEALYETLAVKWVAPDPVTGQQWFTTPVFGFRDGHFACRYSYTRTLKAAELPDAPKLAPLQREGVELIYKLVNSPEFYLDMYLEPGDLQFVVNHQIVHARTQVEDYPELDRKRHVMRMWLATPSARPLPESWANAYGPVESGKVRGGVPWWMFPEQFAAYRQRTAANLGMTV